MNAKNYYLSAIVVTAALFTVVRVHAQAPPPPPAIQSQPPSVADIKVLAKGGVGEEVILSQIRNSHAVYHLNTADILDMKDSGVSEKVIDFMINTANANPNPLPPVASMPPSPPPPAPVMEVAVGSAPPPPVVEQVIVSPGPDYIWVGGAWVWRYGHWEWSRGHWALPPRRGAVWVVGGWEHHGGRTIWVEGSWR